MHNDLQQTIIVPPGSTFIHRILPCLWLSVLGAARWAGYPCTSVRAPAGIYQIVRQTGHERLSPEPEVPPYALALIPGRDTSIVITTRGHNNTTVAGA